MSNSPFAYQGTTFVFGSGSTIASGLTRFLSATGGTAAAAELAVVLPAGGRLKHLCWSAEASTLTGLGHNITVTVDGAATPLSCLWDAATKSGSNTSSEITIAPGSRIAIKVVLKPGGTSITRLRASVLLECDLAIPLKNDGGDLIYDGGGKIGIGLSNPDEALSVDGIIESVSGGFKFPDGTLQSTAYGTGAGIHSLNGASGGPSDVIYVSNDGKVGIGLDVANGHEPQENLTLAAGFNFATEMRVPVLAPAVAAAGGYLPNGSYRFWVVAFDGNGWTSASDLIQKALTGDNSKISLSWDPVPLALKYRLYRELQWIPGEFKSIETQDTFFDYVNDAPFAPDAPPYPAPESQTKAFVNKISAEGPSWINGGNLGIGTHDPQHKLSVNGSVQSLKGGFVFPDGSVQNAALPAGILLPYAGGGPLPQGFLHCDGREVSRITYARLFAVFGTSFGSGDGSTTFHMPDMRGRAAIGTGLGRGLPSYRGWAEYGGEERVTLIANEIPPHHHGIRAEFGTSHNLDFGPPSEYNQLTTRLSYPITGAYTHHDGGGGASHNNMPPYLAISYIICTGN